VRRGLGRAPPPPRQGSCLGLQVLPRVGDPRVGWHRAHRSDVAAVGGSWEDLKLELQLPDNEDPASAWSPVPLPPCGQRDRTRKVPEPCRTLRPIPLGEARGDALAWHGASPHDPRDPRDPPAPTRGRDQPGGPALPWDTTHMSLQAPLKAFHHGSDSSVEVMCWSRHF